MHTEIWEFTSEQMQNLKRAYNVKTGKEALEKWVFRNYDIRHTNGLDYKIGRNKVTIYEYDM